MSTHLILSRRFAAMFGAMALGAFNDNFYKNAMIVLITYRLAEEFGYRAETLISIASASFILPFFLFSGFAGNLADKFSKSRLVRGLKLIEMLLYALAALALLSHHLWVMLIALFLLGSLAAFFGPVKYAILPELMRRDEILRATGWIEGGTYVSILLGTVCGTVLVMVPNGPWIVAALMALMGLFGIGCAWLVPVTKAAQPQLALHYNIAKSVGSMMRLTWHNESVFTAILGISWFWAIGATYLTQLPVFTKEVVGGNEQVVSLYMGVFTVGIALGSLACSSLARIVRPNLLAIVALVGVMLAGFDLCRVGYQLPPADALISLAQYFDRAEHWHLLADLVAMALCGGLFIVPLYSVLQLDAEERERARLIAGNNVMNALFVVTASLIAVGLYALRLSVLDVLVAFNALNLLFLARLWQRRRVIQGAPQS